MDNQTHIRVTFRRNYYAFNSYRIRIRSKIANCLLSRKVEERKPMSNRTSFAWHSQRFVTPWEVYQRFRVRPLDNCPGKWVLEMVQKSPWGRFDPSKVTQLAILDEDGFKALEMLYVAAFETKSAGDKLVDALREVLKGEDQ